MFDKLKEVKLLKEITDFKSPIRKNDKGNVQLVKNTSFGL